MKKILLFLVFCLILLGWNASSLYGQVAEWQALSQKAIALYKQGHLEEARLEALKALSYAHQKFGPENKYVATSLLNVGDIYFAMKKYIQARTYLEEALEMEMKFSRTENIKIATIHSLLGNLCRAEGQHDKALEHLQKALGITRRVQGEKNIDYPSILNDIAWIHADKRNYEKAVGFQKEVIRLYISTDNQVLVSDGFNDLAIFYRKWKKYEEAVGAHKFAVNIFSKAIGEHYRLGVFWNEYAKTLFQQKKYEDALLAAKAAYSIYLKKLGRHPEVAENLDFQGMICSAQKKYKEASKCFEYSLRLYNEVSGIYNKEGEKVLEHLIEVHKALGNREEVKKYEALLTQVLDKKYKKGK